MLTRLTIARELIPRWINSIKRARPDSVHFLRTITPTAVRCILTTPVRQPLFIVGSPRSGTTFLGRILSRLPSLAYYYEPSVIKYLAGPVYDQKISDAESRLLYRIIARSLMCLAPQRGSRFAEKTPRNIFVVEALKAAFPNAQFIHLYRDGRDVTCSLLQKPWHLRRSAALNKREPGGRPYGPYPPFYIEKNRTAEYIQISDVRRCAWIWRRHAEQGLALRDVLPAKACCDIRYEDLVAHPTREVERLLVFLGESDPAHAAPAIRLAQTAFQSSVGTWKQELNARDKQTVLDEAGAMLRAYGYIE